MAAEADFLLGGDCELPSSLIVANIDASVFDSDEKKAVFETVFKQFDGSTSFQYFTCFRRARVNFSSSDVAAQARIQLHETDICGQKVKCYFVQPTDPSKSEKSSHLCPPALEKQYLISPPASPPVGWEPHLEAEPTINFDIITAIAELAPGQAHELHPQTEGQPGIVVHICEEAGIAGEKGKIMQTRRPEHKTS